MASQQDIAYGDDIITRTTGRRITIASVLIDLLTGVFTVLWAAYFMNMIRLNVYQPQMMGMNVWSPYWRVFSPGLIITLVYFLYVLVFYKRAPLLILFLVLGGLSVIMGGIFIGFLIKDWKECSTTLWCPCLTSWGHANGLLTMTYCDSSNTSAPSGVFLFNFWALLALLIIIVVLCIIAIWIFFQYAARNALYDENNPNRTIAYGGPMINDEMTEKAPVFTRSRESLYSIVANNVNNASNKTE